MMGSGPLLEVQGCTKAYGGVVANENISLSVPKGRIVGLIGPNGSGKTTLFNSIVGYHPIDSGNIRFAGQEILRLRVDKIARLGLLRTFQHTHVYQKMTCVENMLISVRRRGDWRKAFGKSLPEDIEKADALLEFVGLYSKRDCVAGDLSFGQQKLLEFAMALIYEPELLLLDEPTAGINPTLINSLIDRLKHANEVFGVTFLVIEHNMRVIMNLADHIYCLAHGKPLADGTPDEIQRDERVVNAYLGTQ